MYDHQNIFAKILRGEIPADKVVENQFAFSFRDIAPQAPVHVLVIPRAEVMTFSDFSLLSKEEQQGFWDIVSQVIELEGLDAKGGYRLITNAGEHGGQEVPHFHVHILGGKFLGGLRL